MTKDYAINKYLNKTHKVTVGDSFVVYSANYNETLDSAYITILDANCQMSQTALSILAEATSNWYKSPCCYTMMIRKIKNTLQHYFNMEKTYLHIDNPFPYYHLNDLLLNPFFNTWLIEKGYGIGRVVGIDTPTMTITTNQDDYRFRLVEVKPWLYSYTLVKYNQHHISYETKYAELKSGHLNINQPQDYEEMVAQFKLIFDCFMSMKEQYLNRERRRYVGR